MCIILFGIKSDIVKLDLEKCWASNHDGAGILTVSSSPTVTKGLLKYSKFEKAFKAIPDSSEIVVHFRTGTHGANSAELTHPFRVGQSSWLFHNGVVSGLGDHNDKGTRSDTSHLAEILSKLSHQLQCDLLSTFYSNRFLLFKGKPKPIVTLFGSWVTVGKVQCSNSLLCPIKHYVPSFGPVWTDKRSCAGIGSSTPAADSDAETLLSDRISLNEWYRQNKYGE